MHHPCTALLAAVVAIATADAQSPAPGMRLFQGVYANETQLMDVTGAVVHVWPGTSPALCSHLDEDGTLLRTSRTLPFPATGVTGRIERLAYDGTVLWDFALDGPTYFLHHDFDVMPNGNILAIAWHLKTAAEATAAGRNPALLGSGDFFPDAIVELRQTGPTTADIVWEWRVWDHMVQDFDPTLPNFGNVAASPGRIDINYPAVTLLDGDWNHFNGIDYDPINDWIVVSSREQNEIWIIDHSTTTAEAAGSTGGRWGKGGDLLWRWGNPECYRAGGPNDRQLGGQHDPRFIPTGYPGAGNVTLFNNIVPSAPNTSAVYELVLPKDPAGNLVLDPSGVYGPTGPVWSFSASTFFYSTFVSSAVRLPNGHTLVCSGSQALLFEVDASNNVVWTQTQVRPGPVFQCQYVERTLWASGAELSVSNATTIDFDLLLGSDKANGWYMLLGTLSGTDPGVSIAGVHLPINVDFLTSAMASGFVPAFQGIFQNTIGILDAGGGGAMRMVMPPGLIPPGLAGSTLHFAVLATDAGFNPVAASNPVPVVILP